MNLTLSSVTCELLKAWSVLTNLKCCTQHMTIRTFIGYARVSTSHVMSDVELCNYMLMNVEHFYMIDLIILFQFVNR